MELQVEKKNIVQKNACERDERKAGVHIRC